MQELKKTAIAAGVAQAVLLASGALFGHAAFAADNAKPETNTVVVVGQRAALASAQKIKQDADEIVDSVVADDIGKLPDKSVTEVLQRIAGVTIDRTLNRADPQQGVGDGINHFAAEGTGVSIRGLSLVRSELNGRDAFSANGGRSLSFEDVPPELMAGIDVYKNPSAEQIEGGIGGLVNLRTALPFDHKGRKVAFSVEAARSVLRGKNSPAFSGLVSDRWDTPMGQFGALLDVAHSRLNTRSDGMQVSPYIPLTNAVKGDTSGKQYWVPPGGGWTSNNFERDRDGLYGALQWKKDSLSSALTYFRSKYKMHSTENALFSTTNPLSIVLDPGATFDDKGALLMGTMRAPKEPGIGVGTDSRAVGRDADTRDLAWNLQWRANSQWVFKTDVQRTTATTSGWDNTIGLDGYAPKESMNLATSPATLVFDAQDRAFLGDANNYYWSFAQEHRDHAVASQNAARIDAKYTFENPVLNDLRFGVRFTDRKAETRSTHDSEWSQITQSWAVGDSWQPLNSFAYLKDPRFAGNNMVHAFNNFFGGKVATPPSVVVPDPSMVVGTPPEAFAKLHGYTQLVCKAPCPDWIKWSPAPYGDDKGLNVQNERTKAAYAQLRFGFEDLPYPVDGNVGLRVVRTDMSATGYTLFSPPNAQVPGVPLIAAQSDKQSFDNSYTNYLPSLNLRMKAGSELQFRAAFAKGMTRPEFYQMQAYTTLSQNVHTHQDTVTKTTVLDSVDYSGNARGNPMLRPTQSSNIDLSAEWYFGRTSSLTMAVFNKRLKDIIIGRTTAYTLNDNAGQPHDFLITAPVNGAKGRATGVEIGYQQYFDRLPGWLSGFGVSGNYTYIDSRLNLGKPVGGVWCTPKDTNEANMARDLAGCDTDGHLLGGVPMTGLSKNAMNFALLYDQGPWSARVAYGWRSKYLQAVNGWGTAGNNGVDLNPASPNKGGAYTVNYALPTWGGAYGQVDMGMHYKVDENFTVAFEAQNLNNALYKQYMQQQIGLKERGSFYTGRRYTLQARYSF
ncbi:TonB-dependent receptor [Duganella sp. FT92W]|uniref:TonB-dependent receptor n=1 Tax=Pseudoduganella rivuli TaxID=2666085 RepID=A0A7X2LT61_9BURK|nr:TonB-dependent receptor [Pseudoduganella rivuli]MRV72648.1 TonB-dependent receptor [Pseudoduganella rivuli]